MHDIVTGKSIHNVINNQSPISGTQKLAHLRLEEGKHYSYNKK